MRSFAIRYDPKSLIAMNAFSPLSYSALNRDCFRFVGQKVGILGTPAIVQTGLIHQTCVMKCLHGHARSISRIFPLHIIFERYNFQP